MQNFWPSSGFFPLQRNERGWLLPTDDYLRLFLARPELAPVPESCQSELALPAKGRAIAEQDDYLREPRAIHRWRGQTGP